MKLTRQIRVKERQIEQARRSLDDSRAELQRVLHERLSSRTALALGFAGGLLFGWSRGGKRSSPGKTGVHEAARRAKGSLPPHWLGGYLVWPFVLATARDFVVARRPSRREGEGFPNRR